MLLDDAEARHAAQHDVVAAVGQGLGLLDPAGAPERKDRRAAVVVASQPGRSSVMPMMRSPASASATIFR